MTEVEDRDIRDWEMHNLREAVKDCKDYARIDCQMRAYLRRRLLGPHIELNPKIKAGKIHISYLPDMI